MTCLDTSFLIDLLRGKNEVRELKDELDASGQSLSVATPSIAELWVGALLSSQSLKEKEKINELLKSLEILSLDVDCAKASAEIEAELIRKGSIIETEDIMIAGIAIVNYEKLVTRDEHFARIPGLRVLKY